MMHQLSGPTLSCTRLLSCASCSALVAPPAPTGTRCVRRKTKPQAVRPTPSGAHTDVSCCWQVACAFGYPLPCLIGPSLCSAVPEHNVHAIQMCERAWSTKCSMSLAVACQQFLHGVQCQPHYCSLGQRMLPYITTESTVSGNVQSSPS